MPSRLGDFTTIRRAASICSLSRQRRARRKRKFRLALSARHTPLHHPIFYAGLSKPLTPINLVTDVPSSPLALLVIPGRDDRLIYPFLVVSIGSPNQSSSMSADDGVSSAAQTASFITATRFCIPASYLLLKYISQMSQELLYKRAKLLQFAKRDHSPRI